MIGCVPVGKHNNSKENMMSPMSEHDQSRKFADKTATIANETLEKGKAAAEQSAQPVEKSYSVTVENIRTLNVKMIEMARTNAARLLILRFKSRKVRDAVRHHRGVDDARPQAVRNTWRTDQGTDSARAEDGRGRCRADRSRRQRSVQKGLLSAPRRHDRQRANRLVRGDFGRPFCCATENYVIHCTSLRNRRGGRRFASTLSGNNATI